MQEIRGRKLLASELPANVKRAKLMSEPAMKAQAQKITCNRCGTNHQQAAVRTPTGLYYCPSCLNFGRVTSRDVLYHLAELPNCPRKVKMAWSGTLSPAQAEIANQLVQAYRQQQSSLIWAVTGAGKTEMLFAVIHEVLKTGGRVAVVVPRIDVCQELFLRLQPVFPNEKCSVLSSQSEQAYDYTKLVIATTHQMVRFFQAFDLLIVDEVDAFPFAGDELLMRAIQTAKKNAGQVIYLTATPSKQLLKATQHFQLCQLPARYHRRALPVPQLFWLKNKSTIQQLPPRFFSLLAQLGKQGNSLLFVPKIEWLAPLAAIIQQKFPRFSVESVHAKDQTRTKKVQKMRNDETKILLTTTILERGVTFKEVSVVVLFADNRNFSKTALIQIAGRVDRKGETKNGAVYFVAKRNSPEMRQAITEIKKQNKLAQKRGLLQ